MQNKFLRNISTNIKQDEIVINREIIYIIDGLAILLIISFHSLQSYFQLTSMSYPFGEFLISTLGSLGLALFTFSSATKFIYNHRQNINNKILMRKYFHKRLLRLYKPYIGYSILIFPFLQISYFIANRFFNFDHPKMHALNISWDRNLVINFLLGHNLIAPHLWYLFALLVISLFCIFIFYFFDVKTFIYIFPLTFILYWLVYVNDFAANYNMIFEIASLLIIFILGILMEYFRLESSEAYKKIIYVFSIAFALVYTFMIGLIGLKLPYINIPVSMFALGFYNMQLIYGITFPYFTILLISKFPKYNLLEMILSYLGKNAFYIYIFHMPIILGAINVFFIKIFHITSIFYQLITIALIIYISIKSYKLSIIFGLNKFIE